MGLTIGVDIGGTKIAAGVVDEDGTILSTFKVPTPGTAEAIVDAIAAAVAGARAGHEIVGVGIGAAGYVNRQRATVYFAPNIDWRHEPLKDKVETARRPAGRRGERRQRRGLGRVPLRRAARATATSSASRSAPASAAASSSATSCAADASAWPPSSATSGWSPTACCAAAAARAAGSSTPPGRALVRYAMQRANATPENAEILLSLGDGTPEGIEGKHISEAARQGDAVAIDSYRELARWAGAGLADLASLFDPSAFIVGGGLSDEGELVLDPIRKSFRRWLVGGHWRPHAQVLAAQLGNKAGLVGAADLARQGLIPSCDIGPSAHRCPSRPAPGAAGTVVS